jgi:hypothetical protein
VNPPPGEGLAPGGALGKRVSGSTTSDNESSDRLSPVRAREPVADEMRISMNAAVAAVVGGVVFGLFVVAGVMFGLGEIASWR